MPSAPRFHAQARERAYPPSDPRCLAAKLAEINAAFERACPKRPSWVPQGPWDGLAEEMDAATATFADEIARRVSGRAAA